MFGFAGFETEAESAKQGSVGMRSAVPGISIGAASLHIRRVPQKTNLPPVATGGGLEGKGEKNPVLQYF